MRRRLLILFALLLGGCAAPPAPIDLSQLPVVGGLVRGERVLEGDLLLDGDLLVPRGSSLVLRPGTRIYVRASESTKIDPEYLSPLTEILVRGSIRVLGTEEEPVRFIAASVGEEIYWAGIELDGAEKSLIESARIEGAETGVLCIGSSPEISSSVFSGCRYGIVAQAQSSPKILRNRIEKGEGGVFCYLGSSPYLLENRIADNEEEGVFVDGGSRPVLEGNEIHGNAIGLALSSRDLIFDPSLVSGNDEDLRYLGEAP